MIARLAWCIGAALLLAGPAWCQDEPAVEYTILLREPQAQMVDISMSLRGVPAGPLEVALPVWRPGRYVVLDPAGTVREVSARTGAGRPVAIEKVEKSTWRVAVPPGDDEVIVSYRLYANSIGDRTRHADDSHAFLSPAATMMYAPVLRDRPLRVRVAAPEGWDVATGLERDRADPETFVAPSYDVLVDSPLEIGRHERLSFEVDGTPHEIAIWNESGLPRTLAAERIRGDFAKIVRAEREVFGDLPYRRYVFLVHAYPGGGGGTEHVNSTIMQTGPASLRDEDAYKRFLGLVSHEFFHTWNVKQLRPAGLKPYDYQRENYTDLLWVAEGTTSYYDDLCLVRAGLKKPDDYLKSLGDAIDAHRRRPGASVQSLAESSFDAWIKFNRETPDSVNCTVSFYDKGALVSMLLDLQIRKRSGGKASLDTVMRDLYRRFPLAGPGYTTADVVAAAERAGGGSFREFFADYVSGTRALNFEDALELVGLEMKLEPTKKDDKDGEADKEEGKEEGKETAYLGFKVEARDGLASVTSVLADGPAHRAGLIAGDVVLAIDGARLRPADLEARMKQLRPSDETVLTIFRYDRLREIEIVAEPRPAGKWKVVRLKEPSDSQRAAYGAWLGQGWPKGSRSNPDASGKDDP